MSEFLIMHEIALITVKRARKFFRNSMRLHILRSLEIRGKVYEYATVDVLVKATQLFQM